MPLLIRNDLPTNNPVSREGQVSGNAQKIFLSPCQRFVVGLAGVLPLPWGNSHAQPEAWVENFLKNPPVSSFTSPEHVAKEAKLCFEALGKLPFTKAGRLLIGGFTGVEAAVYEVFLKTLGDKADEERPLEAWYEKRDLNEPVVRGLVNSWPELLKFSGVMNAGFPKEPTERTNLLRDVLDKAVQRYISEGEVRVALPVITVSLTRPITKPPPSAPATGSA